MNKQIVLGIIVGMMATGTLSLAASNPSKAPVAQNNSTQTIEINKKKKKKKGGAPKKAAAAPATKQAAKPAAKAAGSSIAKPVAASVAKPALGKSLYAQNSVVPSSTAASPASGSAESTKSISAPVVISAPVSSVTSSAKKSPFGFKYRSYNAMDLSTIEQDPHNGGRKDINGQPMLDNELRAWDRFNFSYALNENISFDIMPQFNHTWFGDRDRPQSDSIPGLSQPYSANLLDTGLYFADSKVATLAGGINMDFVQAYFLPTSEASQKAGQIGMTRSAFGFSRSFGPIDVKWTESFWYYFQQSQTSSVVKTSSGLPVQNLEYRIWSLLDLGLNVTKKFAVSLEAGFMNQLQYADDNASTARPAVLQDNIVLDPEVSYAFNDHFSLALGIWELYDMRSAGTPYYTPLASWNGSEGYFQTTVKF